MSKQYGWMKWGGGQAHGPFDSYELALKDAQGYLGDDEEVDITINEIMELTGEDFVNYILPADDLVYRASESFDDTHGSGDEYMFELEGDLKEAQKELEAALRQWAKKWVSASSDWWIDEGEKITITTNGTVTEDCKP